MSNFRFMRSVLIFDLPVETSKERRDYRKFVKFIKKQGFLMLQKSVYVKLSINLANIKLTINSIKKSLPAKGSIMVFNITEKQFNDLDILLGEFKTEVVNSIERFIDL